MLMILAISIMLVLRLSWLTLVTTMELSYSGVSERFKGSLTGCWYAQQCLPLTFRVGMQILLELLIPLYWLEKVWIYGLYLLSPNVKINEGGGTESSLSKISKSGHMTKSVWATKTQEGDYSWTSSMHDLMCHRLTKSQLHYKCTREYLAGHNY